MYTYTDILDITSLITNTDHSVTDGCVLCYTCNHTPTVMSQGPVYTCASLQRGEMLNHRKSAKARFLAVAAQVARYEGFIRGHRVCLPDFPTEGCSSTLET